MYYMFNNLLYRIYKPLHHNVEYSKINNTLMGLLSVHTPGELDSKNELVLEDRELWSNVNCIFYIPTKQRVYKNYLNKEIQEKIIKSKDPFELLESKFNKTDIKLVNLTPVLTKKAEKKLKEDKLLYFKDDTHWNKEGILAVLPEVNKCINRNLPL